MTLSIIGAGFGRTGTDSMKAALEQLGFGPCHHMHEVINSPSQQAIWRSIASGNTHDWDQVFDAYRSSIDWPSAYFWRELSAHYPKAKILLTVRSSESWFASMEKTIFKTLRESTDHESIGIKLIAERVFGGNLKDREHAISIYEKNISEVPSAFSSDRLLTYKIGDGWEPLCKFLGVQAPDFPFPRKNSADEFNAAREQRNGKK